MNDIVQPWYKQFWPWFLITVPIITVIMSGYLIVLAFNTEDSMVIDDYYKEGKAINLQLAKIKRAKALNIRGQLFIEEQALRLSLDSNPPLDGSALTLDFHHPTLERLDFSLLLTLNAKGEYTAPLETTLSGKWSLTLSPFDNDWKLQQAVSLPRQGAIVLDTQ
ncbi:FixH family protein [Alteromonadaceae bacterium BrNp21-10]|nr:FixH family protein [Alteromonadaceae bacterium BrNp21-10]